jgi:hypothetical protein
MKKFFITLFILIVLGGAVFFFGWAQMEIPPGAYGIARSKTHGIDPRLIKPGEFRWIWYKLIPTNVEIAVFRLDPVNHNFNARNTLPLGDVYAAFAGTPVDFSWEISASLSFSVNPDDLSDLVSDSNIGSQDELDAYEQDLAEKIAAFVLGRINSGDANTGELEDLLTTGSSAALEREILNRFPGIGRVSCLVTAAKFPDFVLYDQVRGLYGEFIARQREYVSAALNETAGNRIEARLRFDELENYGALLSKYPILLEYLALEKANKP